jgi:hypothetical protein
VVFWKSVPRRSVNCPGRGKERKDLPMQDEISRMPDEQEETAQKGVLGLLLALDSSGRGLWRRLRGSLASTSRLSTPLRACTLLAWSIAAASSCSRLAQRSVWTVCRSDGWCWLCRIAWDRPTWPAQRSGVPPFAGVAHHAPGGREGTSVAR